MTFNAPAFAAFLTHANHAPAAPAVPAEPIRVSRVERMTEIAVRACSKRITGWISAMKRWTSTNIHRVSHRFKMSRVDALFCSAQMVYFEPLIDRPMPVLVSDPVGESFLAVQVEPAVSATHSTGVPCPARIAVGSAQEFPEESSQIPIIHGTNSSVRANSNDSVKHLVNTRETAVIRPAVTGDLPAVLDLAERLCAESAFQRGTVLDRGQAALVAETLLASPLSTLLVADVNGSLVGMLGLAAYPHLLSGALRAGEVCWWVNPEARDGVGMRLLRAGEAWARAIGVTVCELIAPTPTYERVLRRQGYIGMGRVCERRL